MFLPACSDDDDGGTGPGNGGGDLPSDGSPQQVIGESGLQALNFGDQIVRSAQDVAGGFATMRLDTPPTWNPQSMAWEWQVDEVLGANFPNTETRFWTFSLQYIQGETPQQTPAGADYARIEVTMLYSLGSYTSENNNRTMTVSMDAEIIVTGLETPALTIEVNGSGEIFADFTIDGEYSEFYTDVVSLHIDMVLTPGGCPTSGSGNLTVQTTIMDWTYTNGSQYDWTLSSGGSTIAGGTAVLPCPLER
jgi:hypothetical protein